MEDLAWAGALFFIILLVISWTVLLAFGETFARWQKRKRRLRRYTGA